MASERLLDGSLCLRLSECHGQIFLGGRISTNSTGIFAKCIYFTFNTEQLYRAWQARPISLDEGPR